MNPAIEARKTNYGWYVVGLTLVNQAISVGILIYSFALFVVPWLRDFDAERSDIMLAIFLLQIGVGLFSPLCGRLMDRYPMRVLCAVGIFAMAIGFALMAAATALWQIILVHALILPIGMVLAGTLAAQTLVTRWFQNKRGLAIGISAMGTSLGGFLFPFLIEYLIGGFGWRSTLLILAVLAIVASVPLSWVMLRRSPPGQPTHRPTTGNKPNSTTARSILGTRRFWIPIAALIPLNASFGGVQFHLGAYVDDLGFAQQLAATLISVTAFSMIVGKLFFGSLGDRIDHRKLYALMAGFMSVALALYAGQPTELHLVVAAICQGLATGGVLPMMGLIYGSRFPVGDFGRVMGLVNLFVMFGSFGSLFSGWIFDWTGSYDGAFLTFFAILVPAGIAMYWLPPPTPLPVSHPPAQPALENS